MPTPIGTGSVRTAPLGGEVIEHQGDALQRLSLPLRLVRDGRPIYVDTPAQLIAVTRLVERDGDGNLTERPLTIEQLRQLNGPFRLQPDAAVPVGFLVVPGNLELLISAAPAPSTAVPLGLTAPATEEGDRTDDRHLPSWLNPGATSGRFLELPIHHEGSTTTIWGGPATLRGKASDYQASRLAGHLAYLPSHPGDGRVEMALHEKDIPRLRDLIGLEPGGAIPEGGPTGTGRQAEWFRAILGRLARHSPESVRAMERESDRSQVAIDAALAYRLTGADRFRAIALAALESISPPMQLDDSNLLSSFTSRTDNSDAHWGPYVAATRYLQKHALAYSLLRPGLDDAEAKRARRRIVQMARVWHDTTPFQYMNNHAARHGAALGSCALALWDEPGLREETREWLGMADYGVGLGLNPIGPDGISGEGSVYANYGDQAVLTYLRQVLEATGRSPALSDPRLRAYLQFMANFYRPSVGWQSWDDGNPGKYAYLPLLMAPGVPDAPLIKRKLGDAMPIPGDAYAEAILFADPFDEVVPATAAELDGNNLFYEDGGVALFRSDRPGETSWRLALIGEHRESQGHEKSNRGTFLVAVEDASGTDAVTYVPGGTKDVSYSEGALPPRSSAPDNELGGPLGEDQDPMLGSFDAHGIAASGVRNVTDGLLQSRQVVWVRDGEYALFVDWSESDVPRRVGFRFQGSGDVLPDGGFRLDNGTFLRFDPVADAAPLEIDPLGHHSDGHATEDRHPVLRRNVVGKKTSLLTVASADDGHRLEGRALINDGAEVGTAIASDGGEDWILRAPDHGALSYENIAFTGVGALVTGVTRDPPESVSLFHGRDLRVGDLHFSASTDVDMFFKLSADHDRHGIQGEVVGPESPWELVVDAGFPVRGALFNGEPVQANQRADGSWALQLHGTGRLSLCASTHVADLVDGPQPLAGTADHLDARSVRERSTLEYLGSMPDDASLRRALQDLTPEERQRLTYEIVATAVPAAYAAVVDRLAGLFGLPTDDFDALVGALMLWGAQGGAFPISIGAENVSDDGRVLGASVTGNLRRDPKLTRVHVYGRWESGAHGSVEYTDPTDSYGGLWAPDGTGLDTGRSVTVRGGGPVGDAKVEGYLSHATTEDFSETGAGASVTGSDAGGGANVRITDGSVAGASGHLRVGSTEGHGNFDRSTEHLEIGVRHGGVDGTYSSDAGTQGIRGGVRFSPGAGTFAHVTGGMVCNTDGSTSYEGSATVAGKRWLLRGGFADGPEGNRGNVSGGIHTDAGSVTAGMRSEGGNVIWSGTLSSGGDSVRVEFDRDALRRIGLNCRQQILGTQMNIGASVELSRGKPTLYGLKAATRLIGHGQGSIYGSLSLASSDFKKLDRFKLELRITL